MDKINKEDVQDVQDEIQDSLDAVINFLCINYQEMWGIRTGDVDPLSAFALEEKERELAKIVTDILCRQKEIENGKQPFEK